MLPDTSAPGANGDPRRTPNHSPNCCASVMARQTRERGAGSTICFSMRSVDEAAAVMAGALRSGVVGMAEQLGEPLQADVPQPLVVAQPGLGLRQRARVDADVVHPAAHRAA